MVIGREFKQGGREQEQKKKKRRQPRGIGDRNQREKREEEVVHHFSAPPAAACADLPPQRAREWWRRQHRHDEVLSWIEGKWGEPDEGKGVPCSEKETRWSSLSERTKVRMRDGRCYHR